MIKLTDTPRPALYSYRCTGCGHSGEVRLTETLPEVTTTCSACGNTVLAEWDAGVELHTAPRQIDPARPPFRFSASTFVNTISAETDNGDYDADTRAELQQLRLYHPEISHWGDLAVFFAWNEYSQDCWMSSWHFIENRNANFLCYLCWRQTRGAYPRGAGDELADEATEWMATEP